MDFRSHELFAEVLLKKTGRLSEYSIWGNAPDIDMKFFHRWYRHRFSVIDKIYKEYKYIGTDKVGIALAITSHIYLDVFNSWVFPFGIFYPVYPRNTIIYDIIDDINKPKAFVKKILTLSGEEPFVKEFYDKSREIMERCFRESEPQIIISDMIKRLSAYSTASNSNVYSLQSKAKAHIAKFTCDESFVINHVLDHKPFDNFEKEYTYLIIKSLDKIHELEEQKEI